MTQNLPGILFLIPFLAGLLIAVLGPLHREFLRHAVILVLAVFTAAALWALYEVLDKGPIRYALSGWAPPVGIEWHLDGLAGLMIVLVAALSLLSLLNVGPEINRKLGHRIVHFYTLVLILISALTGIVLSADLFNLFVFFEVASLCAYALVAVSGGSALLSAFRYLILGTIGASFYLLGVGYLYAATGTLNMADLAERLPALLESRAVISGLVFIFIGLGVKMALIPLHGWLPDAYAHAPDWVTPLLSSLNTKVALYAMVRISFWMGRMKLNLACAGKISLMHIMPKSFPRNPGASR